MQDLDNNIFDKELHDKMEDHESDYSAEAWKNMQSKLDGVKQPFFGSGFKKLVIVFSLLLLLLSVSFLTGYEFRKHDVEHVGSSSVVTKSNDQTKNEIQNQRNLQVQTEKLKAPNETNVSQKKDMTSLVKFGNMGAGKSTAQVSNNKTNSNKSLAERNSSKPAIDDKNINSVTTRDQPGRISELTKTNRDSLTKRKDTTLSDKPVKEPGGKKIAANNDVIDPQVAPKRTISFGPYIGYGANFAFEDISPTGSSSLGGAIGAFINFPLTDKISIQSGLGYEVVSNKLLVKSDTTIVNNDVQGKVFQVTQNSTYYMEYLQLPIVVKFRLNHKFRVFAGTRISYALTAPVYTYTTNYKKDSFNNFHYINLSDSSANNGMQTSSFNKNINRFGLEMQIGVEWNMSKSFDLSLTYSNGLTNILKTTNGYAETLGNTNYGSLQFRLEYKLFHKRFHED